MSAHALAVRPDPWPEFDPPHPTPHRRSLAAVPTPDPVTEAFTPVRRPVEAPVVEPEPKPEAFAVPLADAMVTFAEQLRMGHLLGFTPLTHAGVSVDRHGNACALIVAPDDVALEWAERFASADRTDTYFDHHTGRLELSFAAVVDGLPWSIRTPGWRRQHRQPPPPLPRRSPGQMFSQRTLRMNGGRV